MLSWQVTFCFVSLQRLVGMMQCMCQALRSLLIVAYGSLKQTRQSTKHRPPSDPAALGQIGVQTNLESAGLSGDHQWGLLLPTGARVALPTYVPLVAAMYVELVSWVDSIKQYQIGAVA